MIPARVPCLPSFNHEAGLSDERADNKASGDPGGTAESLTISCLIGVIRNMLGQFGVRLQFIRKCDNRSDIRVGDDATMPQSRRG